LSRFLTAHQHHLGYLVPLHDCCTWNFMHFSAIYDHSTATLFWCR